MPSFIARILCSIALLSIISFANAKDKPLRKNELRVGLSYATKSGINISEMQSPFPPFTWSWLLHSTENIISGIPFDMPFDNIKYIRHINSQYALYFGANNINSNRLKLVENKVSMEIHNIYQIGFSRTFQTPRYFPYLTISPQLSYRSSLDQIFLGYLPNPSWKEPVFTYYSYNSLGVGLSIDLSYCIKNRFTFGVEGAYNIFLADNDNRWTLQQYPMVYAYYYPSNTLSSLFGYIGYRF